MGNTRDTGYLQNLLTYDSSGNIILPANLTVNGNLLVATQSYVTTQISNLINGAPALLDTLDELAAALGDDANFASTITTSIAGKQAQLNGTGFVKVTGTTISYDNSTYLTTSSASSTYQTILSNPVTGTGTTNTVPKFTGTSTIGNSLFTDNGTNGAFGGANYSSGTSVRTFNISAPLYAGLAFWTNNELSGDMFSYRVTGNLLINADPLSIFSDTKIGMSIDGTERFAIFNNGNITIANSPTDAGFKLDVNGTGRYSGNLQLGTIGGGSGTSTPNSINLTSTFSTTAGSNLKLVLFNDTGGNIYGLGVSNNQMDFNVPSGATYRFYTGVAIFNNNVGINTNTPTNLLHLAGASATPSLRLGSTSAGFHYDIGRENLTTGDFLINATVSGVFQGTYFRLAQSGGAATFSSSITANGFSSIGQETAFTFQRTTGTPSDVYSLNVDSGSAYLYNNTTASILMYWREGGNVGIGAFPSNSKLLVAGTHVAGNSILGVLPVGDQVATIGVYNSSGIRKGLFYSNTGYVRVESDSDQIQIVPAGNVALTFTTSGQFGFNTDVTTGVTGNTLYIRSSSSNVGQTALIIQGFDKINRWAINGQNGVNNYDLAIYSAPTGANDWTPRFTITPTGSVTAGNGLNSVFTVENNGTFSTGSGAGSVFRLSYGGLVIAQISNTGSGQRDGIFTLRDENVVRVNIAANASRGGDSYFNTGGNFGINTTNVNGRLVISGDDSTYILRSQNASASNQNQFFIVHSLGNVTIGNDRGTVTYGNTSDYRLKKDLKDYDALDIIGKLKTYNFKWIQSDIEDYGVIAHEMQEVLPNYVTRQKDEINEDGSIKSQSVDYSKLVPILVKAVQELKVENDLLKARLDNNNIN